MFNFRGVGRSQGSFGGGIAEQEDTKAAITWLEAQPEVNIDNIGLLGYSFGASVVVPVACVESRVKAFALVSPALEPAHFEHLRACDRPKLVISGKSDTLVTVESVELAFNKAEDPKQLEMIDGADHFWWGHEKAMADSVSTFFTNWLLNEAV
jgi:alpha/beta superfamily hydrolase